MSLSDFTPPSPPPTLAGFQAWVYAVMAIPTDALPTDSPFFAYAYNVALSLVNLQLTAAAGPIYQLAVYNLGGDNLINWAQDVIIAPNTAPFNYPGTKTPYFQYLRKKFGVLNFAPGVVNASADESTSESLTVLKQYEEYTLANLQNLKTPWGRTYLGFAASVGPLWGLS